MTPATSMLRCRLGLLIAAVLVLGHCAPDPKPVTVVPVEPEESSAPADEFASSFRARNSEIRSDIIAELTKRNIPYRLNADGSIGYRLADGEAIDAVYYWAVGLYAARN